MSNSNTAGLKTRDMHWRMYTIEMVHNTRARCSGGYRVKGRQVHVLENYTIVAFSFSVSNR